MSTISTLIAQARAFVTTLRSSIWAIDVRDGIGDSIQKLSEAIEQCYSDVSNPTLKTEALEAALQEKIDQGEMAALTIGDHTITAAKLANGVIPAADATLTISGGYADAKKTGDEITALNESLGDVRDDLGVISFVKDYYINTSTTPINLTPVHSSAGRKYAVIDCSPGDKFVINAYSDYDAVRAWCFIDNSNNAVSMADANVTVTDLELTAPANAVKLIINDMNDGMSYKVGNNLASKIGNGLNNDIKDALLECFRNVAWADDESGEACYKAIQNAIYPDLEKWTWKYTDNDFVKLNGTWTFESAEEGIIRYSTASPYNKSMRVFLARTGKSRKVENTSPDLYPIPVPTFANKATLSVTPSSAYARFSLLRYDASNNKYVMVRGQAWTQGSFTMNFSAGDNLYVMPYVKAAENGTTAFVTEPTEVTLIFEEV